MTGPHSETDSPGTKPISGAELLARNGTIGEPAVTRRRRRRRGDSDAVTVAELTGEIPVVRDDDRADTEHRAGAATQVSEPVAEESATTAYWSEPEPRWAKAPPQAPRKAGPAIRCRAHESGPTGSLRRHSGGRDGLRGA